MENIKNEGYILSETTEMGPKRERGDFSWKPGEGLP